MPSKLNSLIPQQEDLMKYFAEDQPKDKLKALLILMFPRIIRAIGAAATVAIVAVTYLPKP